MNDLREAGRRMNRASFGSGSILTAIAVCLTRTKAVAAVLANAPSPLPQRLITAFDIAFKGPHAGFRPNHAKGFICTGSFVPTPEARAISVATHFRSRTDVLVRFSDFGGYPTVPDNVGGASPYGMAVKFTIPGGLETDMVGHSAPGFPTATAEQFIGFLAALGGGGATLQPYLDEHPKALDFVKSLHPAPVSYATISYYYINAFRFVDPTGKSRAVRYEMRAHEPEAFLDASAATAAGPDYLREEMAQRLKRRPVLFDYIAHVAGPGDITSDPTSHWPADRQQVLLGTISVRSVVRDSDALQRTTLFDPARLISGIELSDDPMVAVRSQSYAMSFARRTA